MTLYYYPFAGNADTTDLLWGKLARMLKGTGMEGSGPLDTSFKVSADSSGLNVKVQIGFGMVAGNAAYMDADTTLAIAAGGALARVDTIILKRDVAAKIITLLVKSGSGGTAPVLTQDPLGVWEEPLADVAVAAGAVTITAGNVTDRRRWVGKSWGYWSTANRPATPRVGDAGWNYTLAQPELWDGSIWRAFSSFAIDASKVTSGILDSARIPGLPANQITSGTLPVVRGGTGRTLVSDFALDIANASTASMKWKGQISATQTFLQSQLVSLGTNYINQYSAGTKLGSTDGRYAEIHMQIYKGTPFGNQEVMATLPVGLRPTVDRYLYAATWSFGIVGIIVHPNGTITNWGNDFVLTGSGDIVNIDAVYAL